MKKFLVALYVDGDMGNPYSTYRDEQIIEAETADEARKEYNRKNNCSYYYGSVLGETDGENITIPISEFMKLKSK